MAQQTFQTRTTINGEEMTLDMVIATGSGKAFFWHAISAGSDHCVVLDENNTVICDEECSYVQMFFDVMEHYPSDILYIDNAVMGV